MSVVMRTKQNTEGGVDKSELSTHGKPPESGANAPDAPLCNAKLEEVNLSSFFGKKNIILNIAPSFDTPTCTKSAQQFNERLKTSSDILVLCISADLPFAQGKFCTNNQISAAAMQFLSTFRNPMFGKIYGTEIVGVKQIAGKSPDLRGLQARAVVGIGLDGKVTYSKLVAELTQEPDYDAVLASFSAAEKKLQSEVDHSQAAQGALGNQLEKVTVALSSAKEQTLAAQPAAGGQAIAVQHQLNTSATPLRSDSDGRIQSLPVSQKRADQLRM